MNILLLMALAGLPGEREDSRHERRMPVLAHYCNWLQRNSRANTWGEANTIPLRPDDHQGYDYRDTGILAEQNAEMLRHGIVPLVSWWGPESFAGDAFLDLYLTIPGPLMGILYEASGGNGGRLPEDRDGWIDFNDRRVVERFVADVEYLHARYWSRPEYRDRWFRIDDRPVLFIWISHAFRGPFDRVAAELKTRVPVFIIGSDFNIDSYFHPGVQSVIRGLDAVSAYGIYHPHLTPQTGGRLSEAYVARYVDSFRAWVAWLRTEAPDVKMIPPFLFAYKDNRGNPELTSTYSEAEHLAASIRHLMFESLCRQDPVLEMTLGVSYNEHYEGTAFEPTLQFGEDWFMIIGTYFRPRVPTENCPPPEFMNPD